MPNRKNSIPANSQGPDARDLAEMYKKSDRFIGKLLYEVGISEFIVYDSNSEKFEKCKVDDDGGLTISSDGEYGLMVAKLIKYLEDGINPFPPRSIDEYWEVLCTHRALPRRAQNWPGLYRIYLNRNPALTDYRAMVLSAIAAIERCDILRDRLLVYKNMANYSSNDIIELLNNNIDPVTYYYGDPGLVVAD